MSEQTNIAWCDSTVNFWSGCTKVSTGCANCYAETLSNRNLGNIGKWGKGAPRQLHESAFKLAVKLNKKPYICDDCGHDQAESWEESPCQKCNEGALHRRRIFSLSLGDWLDPEVPIEWLSRMLDTIRQCDQVTWILCTKRPENFNGGKYSLILDALNHFGGKWSDHPTAKWLHEWKCGSNPPRNVILLTSVENQEQAEKRIPELLKIPSACRGLSLEPLLGPVDVQTALNKMPFVIGGGDAELHWLIIGGESGHGARPCNVDWIRSLVNQGKAAGVATFVKQLGANRETDYGVSRDEWLRWVIHIKGGDPTEWTADLRVQEFPIV